MQPVALLHQFPNVNRLDAEMPFVHQKVRQRLLRSRVDLGQHHVFRIVPSHNHIAHPRPIPRLIHVAKKIFQLRIEPEDLHIPAGQQGLIAED